ncbi:MULTISPECIES: hypothetical protein [Alphaproteobacteria]|uniref:Uncharacterized protein n=1 Tax=Phenylobacterium haematophilum TaxID=98513 RepID=A0A839ZVK6_9CAUL|nr:hypothetical protein [Phenylobacterium haematophilum]MBB3889819.1 hypothetical protein [Phenylobacterium haematophilum]
MREPSAANRRSRADPLAARATAGERYDQFVTALGRRLAKGPNLRQEISEDVPSNESG